MYVLGIDIGTTGTETLRIDQDGKVAGQGYKGYTTTRLPGGVVEQNAEDWWQAVCCSVKAACTGIPAEEVKAISLSTQGGSSLLVDKEGNPLCNAISWMDSRSSLQKQEMEALAGNDLFYEKTGWPLNAGLDACKARWLSQNQPDLLKKAWLFLSTVEFINLRLTGNPAVDPTNAAMRQMMNIRTKQWDNDILQLAGISAELLPPIVDSGTLLGTLTAQAAEALGLSQSVQVFAGAHDQYCCSLGSGSTRPADVLLGTGTAWAVLCVTEHPLFTASRLSPCPHPVAGLWGALSTVPCGGVALEWIRDTLSLESYSALDQMAENRMRKNAGLFFFPFFTGMGAPFWDSRARGTYVGLELQHTAADMALAVMEGVAFQTAALLDEYRAHGVAVESLRVMGGAGKSKPWMQILSSVTRCPVDCLETAAAAPLGAGMIAGTGCGLFPDYTVAAQKMVHYRTAPPPSGELIDYYSACMAEYRALLPSVKRLYENREC